LIKTSAVTSPRCPPLAAKSIGQTEKLRAEWESIKVAVMESLLQKKFVPHTELAKAWRRVRDKLLPKLCASPWLVGVARSDDVQHTAPAFIGSVRGDGKPPSFGECANMNKNGFGIAICAMISALVACSGKSGSSATDAADSGSLTLQDSIATDAHDSGSATDSYDSGAATDAHDSGTMGSNDANADSIIIIGDAASDGMLFTFDGSVAQAEATTNAYATVFDAENAAVPGDGGSTAYYTVSPDGAQTNYVYNGYQDPADGGTGLTITGTDTVTYPADAGSDSADYTQNASVTFTGGLVTSLTIQETVTDNGATCTGTDVYHFSDGSTITCDCSTGACS
jgi:hypothetical protein